MAEQNAAFVTGGTGARGRAVVRRFLADGHAVAVTYLSPNEWDELRVACARDACPA